MSEMLPVPRALRRACCGEVGREGERTVSSKPAGALSGSARSGGKVVGMAGHDRNLTEHTFAFRAVREIGSKSARFGRTSESAVPGQAERAA
jgi:hypothetical protein